MNIEDLAVQGRKSIHGNLAQRTYSEVARLRNSTLRSMLTDTQMYRHRNEIIATIKGVNYIDDSKSITPNSTWFTFERTYNPVIWILELSKNVGDLTSLVDSVRQKVHTLIIAGERNAAVQKTFSGLTNLIQVNDLQEAVKTAYFFANEPDVVIYSPACGESENVERNGERYYKIVNDL